MPTTTHIHVREARDRLIDLLGIGQTYPLRDLAVRDEQLTVAFNTAAKVPVDDSQADVLYQLRDRKQPVERTKEGERGPGVPIEAQGNGGTLRLETYRIQDDITFEILARKLQSGKEAYLHETATVKVGLDTALQAWIKDAPFLDPAIETQPPTDPRIIYYGESVEAEIQNSQEGVDYRLVCFREAASGLNPEEIVLSDADALGDLHNIVLRTRSMEEDTDIRIRATKTFDPSENRPSQTALLDGVLPLKVRANPALGVSVDPEPIIDFLQPATLKIFDTQQSVQYRLYTRNIRDRDFVRGAVPDTDVIRVGVEGEPDVQVLRPARGAVWALPEGYVECGDFQPGTGGELEFQLEPLTDDCLVVVRAQKTHQAERAVSSAMQLEQAAVILVRPDPAPALWLRVSMEAGKTNGELHVFEGQPGVFYFFRRSEKGKDLGLPAYFHKKDDLDPKKNKGVDQLALEVDFVIGRSLRSGDDANLAEVDPLPPVLTTQRLSADTTLYVRAVKAQTRVTTSLTQTANIAALPEIGLEETVVDYGASARILVTASLEGDRYQPLLNGEPVKQARNGNGKDLVFVTGAITEDTEFEVVVTRPNDKDMAVERVVRFRVSVRPDSGTT